MKIKFYTEVFIAVFMFQLYSTTRTYLNDVESY